MDMFEFTACLWGLALAPVTAAFMTHLRTVLSVRCAGRRIRARKVRTAYAASVAPTRFERFSWQ